MITDKLQTCEICGFVGICYLKRGSPEFKTSFVIVCSEHMEDPRLLDIAHEKFLRDEDLVDPIGFDSLPAVTVPPHEDEMAAQMERHAAEGEHTPRWYSPESRDPLDDEDTGDVSALLADDDDDDDDLAFVQGI